jgi:hypothetical protein
METKQAKTPRYTESMKRPSSLFFFVPSWLIAFELIQTPLNLSGYPRQNQLGVNSVSFNISCFL